MKAFLSSDAGKAVIGLLVTAILIVWPAAAGWLAASITLSFSVAKLKDAFARLEEQERAEMEEIDETQHEADDRLAVGHDRRCPAPR